jgi:hypothetical protein
MDTPFVTTLILQRTKPRNFYELPALSPNPIPTYSKFNNVFFFITRDISFFLKNKYFFSFFYQVNNFIFSYSIEES